MRPERAPQRCCPVAQISSRWPTTIIVLQQGGAEAQPPMLRMHDQRTLCGGLTDLHLPVAHHSSPASR